MNAIVGGLELCISGGMFRCARLRHEWCEYFSDPARAAQLIRERKIADLFTFVDDLASTIPRQPFHREATAIAVLPITTYEAWWNEIGKKKRNQIRKAAKSGVEVRVDNLGDAFAAGVSEIYAESPVRQGRRFGHYRQTPDQIQAELSSFLDQSIFAGAYVGTTMVGFMKLFVGPHSVRIINVLSKLSERDRCVMDALMAKAVEIAILHHRQFLHYGSWADRGIGAFRLKHGFQRAEVARYYVPLTWRGTAMLRLKLHHSARERLPKALVEVMVAARAKWNELRFANHKEPIDA